MLAFWPSTAASTPAGTCPEDKPHIEPTVSCTALVVADGRRTLYLGASDRTGTYAAKVVDGATDEAGFERVQSIEGPLCGAGDVDTAEIVNGGFVVLP